MNEQPTDQGTAEPGAHESTQQHSRQEGPRVTAQQVRDLGSLRRSTQDRHVAGVAGGLARHLDVDPIILRVAFVVLTFFGGAGLVVYIACWLLVPEDTGAPAAISLDNRSRTFVLFGVGGVAALLVIGDAWGPGWFPWPLIAIGVIAWVFLARKDRRDNQRADYAPYAPQQYAAPVGQTQPYAAQHAPQQPYAAPYGPQQPSGPVPPMTPAPPRPPRDPRKRGPILFWFTLALTALAIGTLCIIDLAGAEVADSAYPALALAVIGVMLLVGAFFGRAGGLIFLGLIAAVGLSGATLAERYDGTEISQAPTSANELDASYDIDAGSIRLDLTGIRDLDQLDGRTLDLRAEFGEITVIVPDELHVTTAGEVEVGQITFFGHGSGGFDISLDGTNPGQADTPHLHIDTDVEVGNVEVSAR